MVVGTAAIMGRLVKIAFLLTVTLFVMENAAVGIARLTHPSTRLPLKSLMSKQPTSALKDYSCLLHFSETGDSASALCEFTSAPPSSEDKPEITFVVQSPDLRLGDLLLCLGWPTGVQYINLRSPENLIEILWEDQIPASTNPHTGQFDYFLPIPYLSVEGEICRSTQQP